MRMKVWDEEEEEAEEEEAVSNTGECMAWLP